MRIISFIIPLLRKKESVYFVVYPKNCGLSSKFVVGLKKKGGEQ